MNFDYGSKIDRPSDIDEIKTPPVAHTKDDSLQIREHVKRVAFGLLSKKETIVMRCAAFCILGADSLSISD